MRNDLFLLAADNFLESAARYLRRSSTYQENLLILLFAAAIAGIWIALILWERHQAARSADSALPQSLFEELCQAHRLGPQEVITLVDAAQECHLPGPSFLFVQPECLDRLSAPGLPKCDVYGRLRERLFGKV